MCIVYNLTLHISRVLIGEHLIFYSSTSPTCCHSSSKRAPVNSPVAKGVWYDKLGGILPPIWMSTIMSKVSKKIGCQEQFYLPMCILQIRITTDQVFLCFYWNQVICYELSRKIKTTCQINMTCCQNVSRKWN